MKEIILPSTILEFKWFIIDWSIKVAADFCYENSRTIQEHFKNISILFKNISNIENIITIDLTVALKSLIS